MILSCLGSFGDVKVASKPNLNNANQPYSQYCMDFDYDSPKTEKED